MEPVFEGTFGFASHEPFRLDGGGHLSPVALRYAVYGREHASDGETVLVCHALTGSARAAEWWPGMFGPGRAFDTRRVRVVCSNVIGSCYGSTGPRSADPATGTPFGSRFPLISVGDMVRAQARLLDHLAIARVRAVIGGSLGAMQALQWAVDLPDRLDRCIAIGGTPLTAMGLAFNHLQRWAIGGGTSSADAPSPGQAAGGLALARAIATCSYKSADLFSERFGRRPDRSGENPFDSVHGRFDVAGYLDHQGRRFVDRFDPDSYVVLTKAMDTFDPAVDYGSEEEAYGRIRSRLLLIGISSDWLFPPHTVRALADRIRSFGACARYAEISSRHGHDGFLVDTDELFRVLGEEFYE